MVSKVLVVGYGSVGKKYISACRSLGRNVVIYDPYVEFANGDIGFHSFEDLRKKEKEVDLAILCDYSFTRLENFESVLSLNPKVVVLEKLVANSFEDCSIFRETVKQTNLKVKTHLRWNILEMDVEIVNLAKKFDIGNFLSMEVSGGNVCLSMGGAHWVGLFLSLANIKSPTNLNITSNIEGNYDSPRREDISVLSGYLNVRSSHQRELSLRFHPMSRVAPDTKLIFEGGFIRVFLDGSIMVYGIRNYKTLKSFQYKFPSLDYSIPSKETNLFESIIKNVSGNQLPDLEIGLQVSEIILGGYYNSGQKPRFLGDISSKYFKEKCPIT